MEKEKDGVARSALVSTPVQTRSEAAPFSQTEHVGTSRHALLHGEGVEKTHEREEEVTPSPPPRWRKKGRRYDGCAHLSTRLSFRSSSALGRAALRVHAFASWPPARARCVRYVIPADSPSCLSVLSFFFFFLPALPFFDGPGLHRCKKAGFAGLGDGARRGRRKKSWPAFRLKRVSRNR